MRGISCLPQVIPTCRSNALAPYPIERPLEQRRVPRPHIIVACPRPPPAPVVILDARNGVLPAVVKSVILRIDCKIEQEEGKQCS